MSAPAIITVPPKTPGSPAYFEAYWRVAQPSGRAKPVKRRLGKAWIEPDGDGGWRKRRGKCPDGWLTPTAAHVAAAAAVAKYDQEQNAPPDPVDTELVPTVRKVAWEWHAWKRDVKGATPGTIQNDRYFLLDPGTPQKRGNGTTPGRIMAAFGDTPIADVTAKDASAWLRKLDDELTSARNVNLHRAVMHAIFNFAMRADTYGLPANPFASTDRRAEPPPADLDFYEIEEVEALVRAARFGTHRAARTYKSVPTKRWDSELQHMAWEDDQDATLFRVLFYSGSRIGEILALKWGRVDLSPDMQGGLLLVRSRISAGEDVPGAKRSNGRTTPIPRPAAQALAAHELMQADRFGHPPFSSDYVFCNRFGDPLDYSALRRRYHAARKEAGLRPVKLHGLRHAAGSHVARTSSAMFTRDFLGHTKLATTDRYTHSKMAREGIDTVNRAFGAVGPDERSKETA